MRKLYGEHLHRQSGKVLGFEARYEYTLIGVVYEADALLDGRRASLIENGVIVWGLHALPPGRRLEQSVRETIDIIDIEKLFGSPASESSMDKVGSTGR